MGSRLLVAAVGVLLVAGCGTDPAAGDPDVSMRTPAPTNAPASALTSAPAGPAVPAVDGIAGEVVRLRTDEAVGGQVQVRLTASGAGFAVTAVTLTSPAFTAQPPTAVSTVYGPGRTVDLPVPFGPVDCAAPVQPVAAVLDVDRGQGPEQVTVPLAGDALELVAGEQCAARRLAEHVTVTVRDLTADGDRVTGAVVLTRVDAADVVVTGVGRSVLLAPSLDLPARLDGDELHLPLTVTSASCDPHVLAETKKPFVFPLTVDVDGEPTVVDLPLAEGQRAVLQELVDRVCG
ncbi:hypothetical protein SAMN03159343_1702 [Klenkia marina]|uniref:Uncharacterized protein n=1 Tax=Klenkia marina TaxID=1960309 RepID=A0A1G4XXL6_9ACTN|nr:hypothetical protein [Klenkia marina]SCX45924.1 hypothetical protein SAMN03159343_1702 [Klenkia marina]